MPAGFEILAKDWGPESLLAVALLAIILGFLRTRSSVKEMMTLQELRITEARDREQHYREASEKLQTTVQLQAKQLDESMEQGRTIIALLYSLRDAASPQSQNEGRHRGSTQ